MSCYCGLLTFGITFVTLPVPKPLLPLRYLPHLVRRFCHKQYDQVLVGLAVNSSLAPKAVDERQSPTYKLETLINTIVYRR